MSDSSKFLSKMLDRLYASLLSGPGLNCRPQASRQRIDMSLLARLQDQTPEAIFLQLLSDQHHVKVAAKVPEPRREGGFGVAASGRRVTSKEASNALSPEQEAALQAWEQQQSLLNKLRGIVEDARLYTQDTGVHILNVGFPILSVPAGCLSKSTNTTRRILAPIAFIPIQITAKAGLSQSLVIDCYGEGADLVVPNTALLAWLEQQTGKSNIDLFADEEGAAPWREIRELVAYVCQTLSLQMPEFLAQPEGADPAVAPDLKLTAVPKADESEKPAILSSCVLGLFPMANQSLIRDTQEMHGQGSLSGPVSSFLRVGEPLSAPHTSSTSSKAHQVIAAHEHLVSAADPFQAQAVRLAREHSGLVIHGPPGTGKSQTIANIIGDHLARGERALLVCDKRTALDVVAHRLQHLGLGGLCALVHDPQRDRRDLYKGIREQLDGLAEAPLNLAAVANLTKVNSELQELHNTLTSYYHALDSSTVEHGHTFHALVGRWLSLPSSEFKAADSGALMDALSGTRLDTLEGHERHLHEIFERGHACLFPTNPWVACVGIALSDYMARSVDRWRSVLADVIAAAQTADSRVGNFPSFDGNQSIKEQASARLAVIHEFSTKSSHWSPVLAARWVHQPLEAVARAHSLLAEAVPILDSLSGHPLDTELAAVVQEPIPTLLQINTWAAAIEAYLEIAGKWYSFVYSARRELARAALGCFGLTLTPDHATRLKQFLASLQVRVKLYALCEQITGVKPVGIPPDSLIADTVAASKSLLELLTSIQTTSALGNIRALLLDALVAPERRDNLLLALRGSVERAEAIETLLGKVASCGLFSSAWCEQLQQELQQNCAVQPRLAPLTQHISSLETLLRLQSGLDELDPTLRQPTLMLLEQGAGIEEAIAALRRGALEAEIGRHLQRNPQLQRLDTVRLQRIFDRYRVLSEEKKGLTCQVILHRWRSRQKDRLLASTGTRLNNLATELRRRLTLRGERAMRLRQVIQTGQGTEGGDPLFDLCPVWMASPETVAQIFPRLPLFDVVIFDEASQCRLEEALAVLQRGKRVVIAGDPQQLPPTRFFEAAVTVSNEEEPETDQDLFEQQQSEIEDLLNAALNLEIQQCYLDVHYRSRDANLIQFSNQHFYESRLQPIPAHPSQLRRLAAIRLIHADGTYAQQSNEKEATAVCQLIKELLAQDNPPSIGVACFNVAQRDVILDHLDRAAADDRDFAARLTAARNRVGAGSFEGLFVKNLENVQGDERDHMIISTTYGPDQGGRFFRRFGPLGRSGGGRRLNVLVTRAREAIHLITSIPPTVYRSLPNLPAGSIPSGAFLLFAYLQYAETISKEQTAKQTKHSEEQQVAAVHICPAALPSQFAQALGTQLAKQHTLGSSVQWGNEGFCVDVAIQHPANPDDVALGVLCDGPRFPKAPDPVEWDLFRTTVLERQGWKLHRIWTPHFFRDPEGGMQAVKREVQGKVA
jgi:hypothetical protein